MPKPAPLQSPAQARNTIAHRLTRVADRLRQLNTRFGLRSNRVFLVWTIWSGEERGEGDETVLAEVELLPTPRVSSATAINRRPYSAGVFPEGSLIIEQISAGAYTEDMLTGLVIPPQTTSAPIASEGNPVRAVGVERDTDERIDFYYEIVEDGRGDTVPERTRYRVFGSPDRAEGKLQWSVVLQLADEARDRSGVPQIGVDTSDLMKQFGG